MGDGVEDVLAIFISVFLPLALVVIMFSLGLGLGAADFRRIADGPRAFALGLAGQILLIPLVAIVVIMIFQPPPAMALGIMILAFCPGGMSSNMLTRMAHGDVALAVSVSTISTLMSIITMPLLTGLAAWILLGQAGRDIDITGLALQLLAFTALPLAIGVAIKVAAPSVAAAIDPHMYRLATLLFIVIMIAALAANWHAFLEQLAILGPCLLAMFVLLIGSSYGLARLAGLDSGQTTAVTLEVGIQNATLGMTVGALLVDRAETLPAFSLPAAVYGVMMYVLVLPVVWWLRRRNVVAIA